jgi:hypothetical protein
VSRRLRGAAGAYASRIDAELVPYSTSAPIVDKDEYGLIVRDESGAVTSVFRRASLLGTSGTFALDGFF